MTASKTEQTLTPNDLGSVSSKLQPLREQEEEEPGSQQQQCQQLRQLKVQPLYKAPQQDNPQ